MANVKDKYKSSNFTALENSSIDGLNQINQIFILPVSTTGMSTFTGVFFYLQLIHKPYGSKRLK